MYRLRTADKGRPLIISDKVVTEYADCDVDTLHKKNLLSLGEDRYLTTLMTKHFPTMSYKFVPDAYALTAAPDSWSVLLSQRRRWINSTIHNLAELVFLKDLCGFCCFSMRFVVFIDLFGTLILPATCAYLVYLIYRVASHQGQFPIISLIILAAVYGLQAIIFIVKRQWQHIGWMIIYICAYPIYSFILPIYSFWNQDNFSWGNTRIVLGEKGDKKVVALQDDGFDPRSIPLQKWDDYATANNLPGRRGNVGAYPEKGYEGGYTDDPAVMELDDMHSTYSSVKPASTILAGFPQHQGPYMAPPRTGTPMGMGLNNRASTMTGLTNFKDQPVSVHGRNMSMLSLGSQARLAKSPSPQPGAYRDNPGLVRSPYQSGAPFSASRPSLLNMGSRPASTVMDFRTIPTAGPSDQDMIDAIRSVLAEVDLDKVTKKQVRALVEQRLQTEVPAGERRTFLDRAIDGELANM
jgi:chitin synthase